MVRSLCLSLLGGCLFGQQVVLTWAPRIQMPAQVDSNSPVHWLDDHIVVYNSNGTPSVAWGTTLEKLGLPEKVLFPNGTHRPLWIESTYQDFDGTIFAWYHHEPDSVCPKQGNVQLTSPKIGALISFDGGASFEDLGIVLEAGDVPNCAARNGFFASGHGDFTVLLDESGSYFYFFFGNYGGPEDSQGVSVARMAVGDRFDPAGHVWKYYHGEWHEPGLGGKVTPAIRVGISWAVEGTDAFWGPAVHWNTYLQKYVMLLNRSCCRPRWPLEGFYVSFADDLSAPLTWSNPVKFADGQNYYPQAIGIAPLETDKRMGETARFYIGGISDYVIRFDPTSPEDPGGGFESGTGFEAAISNRPLRVPRIRR